MIRVFVVQSNSLVLLLFFFLRNSRDCLFSFTQNALELAVVADVDVVAQDFLSLNLEGLMVTDDVFCAFMVDDPDGIGKENNRHANKEIDGLSRSFSFFWLPSKLICVSIMLCMAKGKRKGRRVHIPFRPKGTNSACV